MAKNKTKDAKGKERKPQTQKVVPKAHGSSATAWGLGERVASFWGRCRVDIFPGLCSPV